MWKWKVNLKLRIASLWLPEYLLVQELNRVAKMTIDGLDNLLRKYAPEALNVINKDKMPMEGNLEERRTKMAADHNIRVDALIKSLGYDKAIKIGRESMFRVGQKLGREAKNRLNVGDNIQDLILAARILYKVLGIEFRVERQKDKTLLLVQRCALARYYSPETCMVLSAADEGVVRGLNERVDLIFKERITENAPECIAQIQLEDMRKKV